MLACPSDLESIKLNIKNGNKFNFLQFMINFCQEPFIIMKYILIDGEMAKAHGKTTI